VNLRVHHPWLLHARHRLRQCTKRYLIEKYEEEELKEISSFISSALTSLLDEPVNAEDMDCHNSICCQMAFELGEYYVIAEDYQQAGYMFGVLESMLSSISPESCTRWM
jgi:catabolite regulation protein CreA